TGDVLARSRTSQAYDTDSVVGNLEVSDRIDTYDFAVIKRNRGAAIGKHEEIFACTTGDSVSAQRSNNDVIARASIDRHFTTIKTAGQVDFVIAGTSSDYSVNVDQFPEVGPRIFVVFRHSGQHNIAYNARSVDGHGFQLARTNAFECQLN